VVLGLGERGRWVRVLGSLGGARWGLEEFCLGGDGGGR
jgi:hypothetical protein